MKKQSTKADIFSEWPYRWGMAFYQVLVTAFFSMGGLSALRKKYEDGFDQRLGIFDSVFHQKPKNAFWVHAASVGEVQTALPLVEMARERLHVPCILSTVTPTGRSMAKQLMDLDTVIYAPWDVRRYVTRTLDALMPKACVVMEAERWPNMLACLRARGVPVFLVNGRLSEASAQKLNRQRRFWRGVLCCFDRLLVRFDSDAERFSSLGIPEQKILVTGDLKIDALFARKARVDCQKWKNLRNDGGPIFLAGSTHPGEEEVVLAAFAKVRRLHPKARLVLSPRHPQRTPSIVKTALPFGKIVLLSQLTSGENQEWDIAVVDMITGTFLDLYAAVDGAFVGGSLVPSGGHNIMEPAVFGISTTHGPDMRDFPDTTRMDAMGASRLVQNADDLAEQWLFAVRPDERTRIKQNCEVYFKSVGGATLRCWKVIETFLG
jgi:3-deoxy-D-manno-octulosonic-acid transferase